MDSNACSIDVIDDGSGNLIPPNLVSMSQGFQPRRTDWLGRLQEDQFGQQGVLLLRGKPSYGICNVTCMLEPECCLDDSLQPTSATWLRKLCLCLSTPAH